jgi:sugar phosphate isomerase/epimerase
VIITVGDVGNDEIYDIEVAVFDGGSMKRRSFLKYALCSASIGSISVVRGAAESRSPIKRVGGPKLKLSCNLYSFNEPLTRGDMTLDQVLEFCARTGFDAVDPTAYYFPGYPKVPRDEYLFKIKRKAFLLGLDISGTGVRNDFTDPSEARREADIGLVAQWSECAARLGAPLLRVFSGKEVPPGFKREEVLDWVVVALRACVEAGARYGVMMALQNHDDFLQNADQILQVLELVNSDWLGVHLDIGSFNTTDPYEDIARCAPYAVTWQIKEMVKSDGKEQRTDLKKIVRILRECGYRGYLPLETLGEGDPRIKVPRFLDEFQSALRG